MNRRISNKKYRMKKCGIALSRRSQPTPPKQLQNPDRLLWRSLLVLSFFVLFKNDRIPHFEIQNSLFDIRYSSKNSFYALNYTNYAVTLILIAFKPPYLPAFIPVLVSRILIPRQSQPVWQNRRNRHRLSRDRMCASRVPAGYRIKFRIRG